MATLKVMANSRNSRPSNPPINRIGRNTAISARVIETIVGPISAAPSRVAWRSGWPASNRWAITSTITTASSTTKPTLRVRAISERLSSEKPNRAITANVAINDTAIAAAGIRAVALNPRNSTTTAITSSTLWIRDC